MAKSSEDMMAMVLAGGRGTRMGLLCEERAKPTLPYGGGRRVIDFVLKNCFESGVTSVAALTDYQGAGLAEYVREWQAANGYGNITILPPKSGPYRGTADAVYQNMKFILDQRCENVLVAAGDHVYEMDYRKMLRLHRDSGADATVAAVRVPLESAHRFGTLKTNKEGEIQEFVEKSSSPVSDLASMGVYIFKRRMLIKRLAEDAANPNSPHDFGYAIVPGMVKRDRVFCFEFNDYWRDIGTVESYYEANMELLRKRGARPLEDGWPILDSIEGLLNSNLKGAIINSIVSPQCIIQGFVQNSILSPGVFVGQGAVVRDSVIMSGCSVGANSLVDHCIMDENAAVGKFCRLAPAPSKTGRKEVLIVGRNKAMKTSTAAGQYDSAAFTSVIPTPSGRR